MDTSDERCIPLLKMRCLYVRVKMTVTKLSKGTEGQALVLFVMVLAILLGIVALTVDGGYALVQRRQMQYAADAAAMAGARALALRWTRQGIDNAVEQYARSNGADHWAWTQVDGNTIRVEVERTFPTFFAGIVGIREMTAHARAEASFSGIRRAGSLLPIAVEQFPFRIGQVYRIWDKSSRPAPGNFGWLDWNGGSSSARELAFFICNPQWSGMWEVGWWVPGNPGVSNSNSVRNCLSRWVNQPATIVIYDAVRNRGHNTRYHIAGFAEFVIVGFNFRGRDKYILGRFERYVTLGEGGGPDYGLLVVTLGSSR